MDIKKAKAVKWVDEKWGLAIFETDWQDKPCKPTVHLLEKQTRKDGSNWTQMTPGWYAETLLENKERIFAKAEYADDNDIGLYIDCGSNWFIPVKPYAKVLKVVEAYVELGAEFHDAPAGEVW